MEDDKYNNAFQIIGIAGDSKADALEAINTARQGDYQQAKVLLESCSKKILNAHRLQFQLIQDEARGNPVDVNIIQVHAQDHLTMAYVIKDLAEIMVDMARDISDLKNNINIIRKEKEQ